MCGMNIHRQLHLTALQVLAVQIAMESEIIFSATKMWQPTDLKKKFEKSMNVWLNYQTYKSSNANGSTCQPT